MSPITGISEEPLGTGRLFATSPPDSGELFATEVDQAIARQGGERSIESRQDAVRVRRETRRSSFEGQRASEAPSEGDSDEVTDMIDEATSPITEPLATTTPEELGLRQPHQHKEGMGMTRAASSPTPTASEPSLPGVSESPLEPGAAAMDAAQLVRMATSFEVAKHSNMQPVTAVSEARPESPTQAFLNAARGSTAKGSSGTGPAGPGQALSDPELVDRATEIMRQIRMNMAPGASQITLDLEPAELGRLWIRLSYRGGKLGAHVRAERQETLDALEPKLAELRELFGERGIEADTIELELGFREETSDSPFEPFEGRPFPERKPTNLLHDQQHDEPSPPPRSVSLNEDGIDTYA